MIIIEKSLFDGKYFSFRNTEKVINNCGIISKNGDVVISQRFENVMYPVGDLAIVTTRYHVYTDPEDVYYGIIDKDMNIIIDPDKNDYWGYDGYLLLENIIKKIYEEKYGIDNDKNNSLKMTLIQKIKY